MATTVITGSASGIGAATRALLEAGGHEVTGIDIRDAEIIADLSQPEGRSAALEQALKRCGGALDRLVLCAGIGGHTGDNQKIASLNFFGALTMLDGLRELELDLHQHIHKENNILFPRAATQEAKLER